MSKINSNIPKPPITKQNAFISAYQKGFIAFTDLGNQAKNPYSSFGMNRFSVSRRLFEYWEDGKKKAIEMLEESVIKI